MDGGGGDDVFSILPNETIAHIFGFLDSAKDVCSLAAAARSLRPFGVEQSVWCRLARTHPSKDHANALRRFREFGKDWRWLCMAITPFKGDTGVGTKVVGCALMHGDWVGGKLHGYAASIVFNPTLPQDVTYEGSWNKGQRSGLGFCDMGDGTTYEGDWKNDRQHGYGLFEAPGLRRIGEFERGKFVGQGMSVWDHGARFVGTYANDVMVEGMYYGYETGKRKWGRQDADGDKVTARYGKIVMRKKRKRGNNVP